MLLLWRNVACGGSRRRSCLRRTHACWVRAHMGTSARMQKQHAPLHALTLILLCMTSGASCLAWSLLTDQSTHRSARTMRDSTKPRLGRAESWRPGVLALGCKRASHMSAVRTIRRCTASEQPDQLYPAGAVPSGQSLFSRCSKKYSLRSTAWRSRRARQAQVRLDTAWARRWTAVGVCSMLLKQDSKTP